MQRVLLVNPPETDQTGFSNPPLGLLYLAGTLLHHGIDVRVVDGCLDGRTAITRSVTDFKPDLVGITCLTAGRHRALEVARAVKAQQPELPVVLGGVHPTILPVQLMEHYPYIDFVVVGEGEQTLLELAQERPLAEIKGLVYRDGVAVKRNPPRPLVTNLDDLPLPAWHLVDLHRYPAIDTGVFHGIDLAKEPRVSVIFSRGCVGHCSFCSTWWVWRGWRHRSAANMVDEIELLYREQGIRHFCFADDALTVDRQATLDLCDEILARRLEIAFFASTRADCVDEVVLRRLKEAGCHRISFGVETASQTLLERMGKKTDVAAARRAIRLSKEAGLRTTALIIVGNEGETEETIDETITFLREAGPDELGCVGGLWIFPGTRLYQNCKRQGYITDDFWLGPEPYKLYELEHTAGEIGEYHHRVVSFAEPDPFPRQQISPGNSPRISLVVNTLNAAPYLEDCLRSVAGAVDEIVVVDMNSDDDTTEIARRHGARILSYHRVGHVEPARNFAVEQATGEWILILDADERLTPAFRDSLRRLVASPGDAQVFQVPYNTFVAGRWLQGTGWGRDRERHPRLFRKGTIRWADTIHATPQITGPEASLPLPPAAAIDHLNYANLRDFVERLNRYTSVEAADPAAASEPWTAEAMLRAARQELLDRYEPAKDGVHSLVLSVAMAFYRFLSLAKRWEQQGYPRDRLPASPQDLLAWLADPNTEVEWLETAQVPSAGDLPTAAPAIIAPAATAVTQPPVRFARGFYRDEGGWRWMGPEGVLTVAAQSLPTSLRFDLTCTAVSCYRNFPFQARILVGEEVRVQVEFDASDQTRTVSLPLAVSESGARVRLESGESFVPARLGLNPDQRRLSLRLGNLTLTGEAPAATEPTGPASGLLASPVALLSCSANSDQRADLPHPAAPAISLSAATSPARHVAAVGLDGHVEDERYMDTNLARLVDSIASLPSDWHGAGSVSRNVLSAIVHHAQSVGPIHHSAETGSGKTTLLLSHLSQCHTVFAVDDGNSISQVKGSLLLNAKSVIYVEGPTQRTLPRHKFAHKHQVVLLDGPHGYPFPDLEYFYTYPTIDVGGLLLIDDILIPSVARMFDIIKADDMFELIDVVDDNMAFLRRTSAPVTDPEGDGWCLQGFNRAHYQQLLGVNSAPPAQVAPALVGKTIVTSEASKDLSVCLSLAATADASGDQAGAEAILRQTTQRHPVAPEPYHQLALLLAGREDYVQSDEMLLRAMSLAPANAALHNEHGTLCLLQGNLADAVAAYQRALALDPSLESARANLAACLQGVDSFSRE